MVPFLSATTLFGSFALMRDCAPMIERVRPAQLTTTSVPGFPASSGTRYTSSAPGQSSPPESLDDWELIGSAADTGTEATIETPGADPSQFYLVWITKLPQSESGGGFTAEISDIRLLG